MSSDKTGSVAAADHPPRRFPDTDWDWFCAQCAAAGIAAGAEVRPRLEALYGHLAGVNAWLNLTRLSDPRDYLERHVLDALAPLGAEPVFRPGGGERCVDLGSGGGYPGLILALWMPDTSWTLIDSRGRKVAFLAEAARLVDPQRVTARQLRGREVASAAPELVRGCQLVTARAVAPAATLLAEARELLARGGRLVAWKGPSYHGEEARRAAGSARKLGYAEVQQTASPTARAGSLLLSWRRVC